MFFWEVLPNYSFDTIFIYFYINFFLLFITFCIYNFIESEKILKERQSELEKIHMKNLELIGEFYSLLK